jgi:hypothetical protein
MRIVLMCPILLIFAGSSMAQSKQPDVRVQTPATLMSKDQMVRKLVRKPGNAAATVTNAEGPPDAPVVTLEGVCDAGQKHAAKSGCRTVITRAQMESLESALWLDTSPAASRQFAINYARLLAASTVAQRQHLEKDPAVIKKLETQLTLVRMQVLANALYHRIEEQAENALTSEIQKYYTEHLASFEQGVVRRLSIPTSAQTTSGQVLEASVVKAKAEELRARAAAGEDFDQLQQAAYKDLGIKSVPASTKLNMLRRSNLPPDEARVFDLKPGDVSQVLESSMGALVILKLESKQPVPLENASSEIKSLMQRELLHEQLERATKGVKAQFNLKYLDMPSAPELFPTPVLSQESRSDLRQQMASRRRMPSRARRMTALPGASR